MDENIKTQEELLEEARENDVVLDESGEIDTVVTTDEIYIVAVVITAAIILCRIFPSIYGLRERPLLAVTAIT